MSLLPARMRLYRMRRAISRRASGPHHIQSVSAVKSPPVGADIVPVFALRPAEITSVEGLDTLLTEVRFQLQGEYRLAGGRRYRLGGSGSADHVQGEDRHAYHRLYWAVRYSQAAAFGYQPAGPALIDKLSKWLESNWESDSVAQWPYTLAERIGSLAEVLFWIRSGHIPGAEVLVARSKHRAWQDASRLSANIEYSLGVHNHLLNNARGLYIASSMLAECPESRKWRDEAFELWDEYFGKLLLPDGTLAEQSSHYHLLLCRTALEYWIASRNSGRPLGRELEARLKAMFRLANDLLRPDGSLPRFGDSSPDRTIVDLWGLMGAACHFGLLEHAPRHRLITPLTLYYCGTAPQPKGSDDAAGLALYPNGGFAFLRWGGVEVAVHGDPRNEAAAHGDSSRGSFEIWRQGQVLIREAGSFCESNATSRYYRSGRAHNITCLNGLSPAVGTDESVYMRPWYRAHGGTWASSERRLRFVWDGFRRLQSDIALQREWWFEEDGNLEFEEQIEGSGEVGFESRICLGEASWKTLSSFAGGIESFECRSQDHSIASMTVAAPPHVKLTVKPFRFVPEYGIFSRGRVIVLEGRVQLPLKWRITWRFSGIDQGMRR